ncbi:MAG: NYN domain-containing protein [Thermoanaerobaculia bacterium]
MLVDGSNLLGALRLDREGDGPKRELLKLLASYGRSRRRRILCFFDGPRPSAFAAQLGHVTARFSAPRSADDAIVEEVEKLGKEPFEVVTGDRALASRCRRRNVSILDSASFARDLERTAEEGEGSPPADEWEAYFSDPKNRNI